MTKRSTYSICRADYGSRRCYFLRLTDNRDVINNVSYDGADLPDLDALREAVRFYRDRGFVRHELGWKR